MPKGIRLKVLHVTNAYPVLNYPSYGIFIKEQIDSLIRMGVSCEIAYIDGINRGKVRYFSSLPAIERKIRRCDIVHCHHTYTGFIGTLLNRGQKPLVTSFMSPRGKEGKTSRYWGIKCALFDHVLKRSDFFIQKDSPGWEKKYPGKGFYIPNGIDLDLFRVLSREYSRKKLNLENRKHILFVSALDLFRQQKQYGLYQMVMKILRSRYGHDVFELLLVNEERSRTPFYFNAAAAHLLCSLQEGSPNSVKEALGCNIPVVSTDVGNVGQLIGDVEGCYVSRSRDPGELAALMDKALKRDRIRGRKKIRAMNLDMASTAEKILHIYEKVLKRR